MLLIAMIIAGVVATRETENPDYWWLIYPAAVAALPMILGVQ